MEKKGKIEILQKTKIFSGFDEKALHKILDVLEEKKFQKDSIIFSEGDLGDAFYVIMEGIVSLSVKTMGVEKVEKTIATLEKGNFFGEMALFDSGPRSASARTLEETTLMKIGKDDFIGLVSSDPQIASILLYSIITEISPRIRRTNCELITLYETGKVIGSAHDLETMLDGILAVLMEALNVKRGIVFLVNEIVNEIEAKFWKGIEDETIRNVAMKRGEGIPGRVVEKSESFVTNDFENDETAKQMGTFGYELKTMLFVPLATKEKVFGAIALLGKGSPTGGNSLFTRNDVNLVEAVASQVSNAIEIASLQADSSNRQRLQRVFYRF